MIPLIAMNSPAGSRTAPLVVLGPSLGTSTLLWRDVVPLLTGQFRVVAWDLPGHGAAPTARTEFSVAELADAVAAAVRQFGGGPVFYAGVSLGGAVGLELALRHGELVAGAAIVASGAQLGTPEMWRERVEQVRREGTSSLITASAQRWFAPGSIERVPELSGRLLHALRDADDESYALCCLALAKYDVRDQLSQIGVPTLALWGEFDAVAPQAKSDEIAAGVAEGRALRVPGAAHLPPAERPEFVAAALADFFASVAGRPTAPAATVAEELTDADRRTQGTRVRREVLSDEHGDHAVAATTDLSADFHDFVTRVAWGDVWSRPGLDRRSRSVAVLSSLIAHGHDEELATQLRAAIRNGLTVAEIREVILQSAIYSGIPAANRAFRVARDVFQGEQPG